MPQHHDTVQTIAITRRYPALLEAMSHHYLFWPSIIYACYLFIYAFFP